MKTVFPVSVFFECAISIIVLHSLSSGRFHEIRESPLHLSVTPSGGR